MNMPESSERELLGVSKRSSRILLAIILLGFLINVAIELFQWLCTVDFFEGSSLLKIGRENNSTLSWIRFFAFAGMLAGMVFGFTKWVRYEVNRHRDGNK